MLFHVIIRRRICSSNHMELLLTAGGCHGFFASICILLPNHRVFNERSDIQRGSISGPLFTWKRQTGKVECIICALKKISTVIRSNKRPSLGKSFYNYIHDCITELTSWCPSMLSRRVCLETGSSAVPGLASCWLQQWWDYAQVSERLGTCQKKTNMEVIWQ